MPETTRSFHYWQPAPRGRSLQWQADPVNSAMSPHTDGETGACHTALTVERGREWRGECLKTCSHEKAMLTVNSIVVKAANTSQSKSVWNPGACTNQDTADNYENTGGVCCSSC